MRACGWDVIDIEDGCFDIEGLVEALNKARAATEKPTFINVRTVIGVGSAAAGNAVAHGAAFGDADVANMKKMYGFDAQKFFVVGAEVRKFFQDLPERGEEFVRSWDKKMKAYERRYPELGAEFRRRIEGHLPENWKELIPTKQAFPDKATATRVASGLVFNPIAQACNNFMVGTADLSPSVNMIWKGKVDFQHVS
jgi:dihydroxyacetone synthase